MPHVKYLGKFEPSPELLNSTLWEQTPLEKKFERWLNEHGYGIFHSGNGYVHARPPKRAYADSTGTCWHHDGPERNQFIVVWASREPTQIRSVDTMQPYKRQPQPYEVWLLNNAMCQHKGPIAPSDGSPSTRWFIVARGVKPLAELKGQL